MDELALAGALGAGDGARTLDGLEVTIVGSIASRLTEQGSGITITESQIGTAAAVYVPAVRRRSVLRMAGRPHGPQEAVPDYAVALPRGHGGHGVHVDVSAVLAACRFFTGAGIGGEYAAINSAIDELIPARVRGTVDLIINGSFWVGTAFGAALSLVLLDEKLFSADVGWRLAFGLGAVLAVGILFVRRNVPESPRWMFIHGHSKDAEALVGEIERDVEESTGSALKPARRSIKVREQEQVGFLTIARTVFGAYPRRTIVGLSLFVGQAFLYNAVFFTYALVLTTFYGLSSGSVPLYIIPFAVGNFLGLLLLGRLFDSVGRKPMIAGCYVVGAAAGRHRVPVQAGGVDGADADRGVVRDLLLRVGGRQRGLSDRQRDLPDGDPGAGHRLLLRGRHRHRRNHRAAAVRQARRDQGCESGLLGLHPRGSTDDRGGNRPGPHRHRGRAEEPRGRGQATVG